MGTITELEVIDVRFPTSRNLDGSDAMNPDPDYSAAYVIVRTDADDGLEGHGFTFTIGRGTECVDTRHDDLRTAADRERETMTFESIVSIGPDDHVRGRVVGIGVHRVRAVEVARRREADVDDLELGDRAHLALQRADKDAAGD